MVKNANRAGLSDQQLAQLLTRQLRPGGGRQHRVKAQRRSCYMDFPTFEQSEKPATSLTEADLLPSAIMLEPGEFTSWQELLDWCVSLSKAKAAFVVDGHGFIVAAAGGDSESETLEGIGAELCYAMEQLERINPGEDRLQSVSLKFGHGAIYSLRAQAGKAEEEFVVGVLSSEALEREVQRAVYEQTRKNLDRFL